MCRRLRGPTAYLTAVFMLAGCAARDAESGTFMSFDSAGIDVAVSSAPAWETTPSGQWSIDAAPVLDLTKTGDVPAHEFFRVQDALTRSDGTVVVANAGSSEIRLYSPTGQALGSQGGEGDGPGEYRQIMALLRLPGDSIGVFSWPGRLSILGADLEFVRSHSLGERAHEPDALPSGDLVDLEIYPSVIEYEGGNQLIRAPAAVVRRSREGVVQDTIWAGPGFEEYMFTLGDRRGSAGALFGKGPAMAVRQDAILVGTSDRMEYQVFDPTGTLQQVVRVPAYDLSVDQATEDAERAAYLGDEPSPRQRELVAQLPSAESRPAYRDFIADSEGYLWAGGYQSVSNWTEPRSWEIFSASGRWMGTLHTPAKFTVFEIGADYLLGVQADELGVEHVQKLALTRAGGS